MRRPLKNGSLETRTLKDICLDLIHTDAQLEGVRVSNCYNEMLSLAHELKEMISKSLPEAKVPSPTPIVPVAKTPPAPGKFSPEITQALLELQRRQAQYQQTRTAADAKKPGFHSHLIPEVSTQVKQRDRFQKETHTRPILRPKENG